MDLAKAREIVTAVEERNRSAAIMVCFGKIEPSDYNKAKGFLAGYDAAMELAERLADECEIHSEGGKCPDCAEAFAAFEKAKRERT